MITQQREEIKPNRTFPQTESPSGRAQARPTGFRFEEFRALRRETNWHHIQIARNSAEFRAFFRRRVRRKKLLLRGKCVRARRSADRRARTRAVRAASPHRPAAPRPGGRPLLALKRPRAVLGQIPAYFLFFLKSPPPSPASSPMERAKARRASFWAELRPLGTATLTVTYWSPRPLPRR